MALFTTAYAGSGKLDEKLIADHLNGLLPEDLGFIFIPDGEIPPRKLVGLSRAVGWLQSQVGVEGTIPVADLVHALVARRDGGVPFEGADEAEGGDEVALVMVHDPDNEGDVALARAAHAAGIRVIDLTHAADDMLFDDEPDSTEPADEADDEAETPKLDETLADTPPWDDKDEAAAPSAPEVIDPGKAVADATAAGLAAIANHVVQATTQTPGVTIKFTVELDPASVQSLADAIVAGMSRQAQAAVASVPTPQLSAVPDLPERQAPAKSAATKAYYHNEEAGTYRPARGIAKQGEVRVDLTPEDEAVARSKGMLK